MQTNFKSARESSGIPPFDRSALRYGPPPMAEERTDVAATAMHGLKHGTGLAGLVIAALGVVYGDIGTSPLYAIRECFSGDHAIPLSQANLFGVISLVFWSLAGIISFKYLTYILRADNHGEGGISALLALLPGAGHGTGARTHRTLILLAIIGAALLYGDGIITPAISVLSALEGIEVATEALKSWVAPLACVVLFALFLAQRVGTGRIGKVFGSVMMAWFSTIAILGIVSIISTPAILKAVNPQYAVHFLFGESKLAFGVLGSVLLCVTGGEALYADMGHFGRTPIRRSWFYFVWPALLCNYFGQGALLLRDPAAAANPFYALVPSIMLYPMVALATSAAVIASQAVISGTFSLTRSAIQLGFLPRLKIVHTSALTQGQIYMPAVNWALGLACIALVLTFQRSSNLAGAYGIAVTGNMTITSVLFYFVARHTWGWPRHKLKLLVALFLVFDLTYLGAAMAKLTGGGWMPLALAVLIAATMTTWKAGRWYLGARLKSVALPLELLQEDLREGRIKRVPGIAVFMASNPDGAPPVLLHHVKHNKVIHERVVLLTIQTTNEPRVPSKDSLVITDLGHGFHRVFARCGFMETPNIPKIASLAHWHGLEMPLERTSFYLGRETLLLSETSNLPGWRKRLFALLSRNAQPATLYFGIPADRVMEIGMQVEI